MHRAKETHARSQALYEKEVRRTRKEGFKSSSTVVKLQEELKSTRSELSITRSDLDLHRVKVGKREQETFEAQYKLVGVQETSEKMKQAVKVAIEESCIRKKEVLEANTKLASVREELKKVKQQAKTAGEKKSKGQQDALEADYRLADVQEELEKVKEEAKIVEEELERVKVEAKIVEEEFEKVKEEAKIMEEELEKVKEEAKIVEEAGSEIDSVREELEQVKQQVKIVEGEKHKREQEALETDHKLVGVQEELENVKRHIKVVEEERDTLKTSLKEEEVARIAAEGKIALPGSEVQDDFTSPKTTNPAIKKRAIESSKEQAAVDPLPKKSEPLSKKRAWDEDYDSDEEDELTKTRKELERERKLRKRWHDQIEYMKMECQFKLCSCRRAEKKGETYVHDNSLTDRIAHEQAKLRQWRLEQKALAPSDGSSMAVQQPTVEEPAVQEPLIEFSPVTGTFKTVKEEEEPQPDVASGSQTSFAAFPDVRPELTHSVSAPLPEDLSLMSLLHAPHLPESTTAGTAIHAAPRPLARPPSREASVTAARAARANSRPPSREAHTAPRRPLRPTGTNRPPSREAHATSTLQSRHGQPAKGVRVVNKTTTTTVPLAGVFNPHTMTREEALEQIRHRRERAKSFTAGTLTPRRQMVEGAAKRDISAPAVGTQKKTSE